jgi:membrane-associated phospholipid phosphatase
MLEMTEAAADTAGQNFSQMYQWGLEIIRFCQAAGNPALTAVARFFTLLGDPLTYLIILPFLFWCVDEKRGFRIGVTVFISNGINTAIKEALRVPRPFVLDPSVKLADAVGFSTPSGHSQNSAVFWPLIAGTAPQKAERSALRSFFRFAPAILLPAGIGLSRIYLGVHFPTDVFFGWTLGAFIAVAALAFPRSRLLGKVRASMAGAFFGFTAGYILLTDKSPGIGEKERFSAADGSPAQKAVRLALGLGVLAVLYAGLKKLFPGEESVYYALFRFTRYGIIGFWAAFGAPKLFMKLALTTKKTA